MNQMNRDRRIQVVRCLIEGDSIRSTVRMTGAAKNTVAKLLVDVGRACSEYQFEALRNLPCMVIQCDEIWSFVGIKEDHRPDDERGILGRGDVWTWVAIDADSKLAITWHVGLRTSEDCFDFMVDLADRLPKRVQLTTDGFGAYKKAVEYGFGNQIDYAMLVKTYGQEPEGEKRYSPAVCTGCTPSPVIGDPLESQVSTSYFERQNLTMRMSMRRFTRLTNAFSKKLENHEAAVALHFMYYNFARPHQTLTAEIGRKTTPAMAARVTDHVWDVGEIVDLLSN